MLGNITGSHQKIVVFVVIWMRWSLKPVHVLKSVTYFDSILLNSHATQKDTDRALLCHAKATVDGESWSLSTTDFLCARFGLCKFEISKRRYKCSM